MPNDTYLNGGLNSHVADMMKRQHEEQEEIYNDRNPVINICNSLKNYILDFERDLDQEHEVGVRLASFGNALTFHAQQIGFSKPNLITFYGVTEQGDKIQLIQHVSQLNFLLKAVNKIEENPVRIGFIWD